MSVSSGCPNKILHPRWLKLDIYFSVPQTRSQRPGVSVVGSSESPLSGLQTAPSHCVLTCGQHRALVSLSSHKGTNPITGSLPLTSSKPNHLPKAPPQEFWGGDTNITQHQGMLLLCSDTTNSFKKADALTPAIRSYQWSPYRGHKWPKSAQEVCEGISWWSQELGEWDDMDCGGPGMPGSPARPKITPHLQAALMFRQTLTWAKKSLVMIRLYNLTALHNTKELLPTFVQLTLLGM